MITKRRIIKFIVLLAVAIYTLVFAFSQINGHPSVGKKRHPRPNFGIRDPGSAVKTGASVKAFDYQRLKALNDEMLRRFLEEFPEMNNAYSPNTAKSSSLAAECSSRTNTNRRGHTRSASPSDATSLPLAPPVFYPLGHNPNSNSGWGRGMTEREEVSCKQSEVAWTNSCCRTVYFLGGGKCGSTSLAILLKHNMSSMGQFDPSSGFADGGKEPCWALTSGGERELYNKFPQCKSPRCTSRRDEVNSGETRSHQERTVVLDGCPRYTKPMSARKIMCSDPDAKFVMLVRDPLLRAISDHNDHLIRGSGKTRAMSNKDRQTLPLRSLTLSDYRTILGNFLQLVPPQNVLIVQSEFLMEEKFVQHIMTQVQNHYNVPNRDVHHVKSNANSEDPKYTLPSKKSFEATLSTLCPKSLNFFHLVGYSFDWILHPDDHRAQSHYQPPDEEDYNL